jgi:hypothetical protein
MTLSFPPPYDLIDPPFVIGRRAEFVALLHFIATLKPVLHPYLDSIASSYW